MWLKNSAHTKGYLIAKQYLQTVVVITSPSSWMMTKKWRECQNNIQSLGSEKSAIKPNVQKGACSHFAMAKRIIEENLTNLSKSNKS